MSTYHFYAGYHETYHETFGQWLPLISYGSIMNRYPRNKMSMHDGIWQNNGLNGKNIFSEPRQNQITFMATHRIMNGWWFQPNIWDIPNWMEKCSNSSNNLERYLEIILVKSHHGYVELTRINRENPRRAIPSCHRISSWSWIIGKNMMPPQHFKQKMRQETKFGFSVAWWPFAQG